MTFKLGLTGSIGMGKSTTAKMFVQEGCVLWDADAAVHRLYMSGGAAVAPMSAAFPNAISDGAVSRDHLRRIIADDPDALKKIETIVHPLVVQDRNDFLAKTEADITVLDIPLLFETGSNATMDAVVCVTAPADVQRARVLERPNMTEAQLDAILDKQMPDVEKQKYSDYVISTRTLEDTRRQVQAVIKDIRETRIDA